MGGTVTEPSRSSLTPSWPPSGLKGWTSNPHKRGLCRNRRVQTACKFSREDEGSREVDGLRSAQALVSIGFGPATSAMGRSAFLVGVASSPSGRGQTLPLQAQTRASAIIYNCSTRLRALVAEHGEEQALGDFLLEELYTFVGEGWEQEDEITLLTLRRSRIRS